MKTASPKKPARAAVISRQAKVKPAAKTVAKVTTKPVVKRKPTAAKKSSTTASKHLKGRSPPGLDSQAITEMFQRFQASTPEPKGELEHVNAYTLLVAVVLSAQATDAGVNKATRALFKVADTPEKMVALGEEKVREYVKTIGLYRNKAKNVIALSEKLIAEHNSAVPPDRDELTKLPGVGRKTANVVLSMAFGQKTMAVDTHVFRVSHRLGLSAGKTPEAVEEDLMRAIPDDYLYHAHHWLILHGRYTCLARNPRCGLCVIAELCTSSDKTATD